MAEPCFVDETLLPLLELWVLVVRGAWWLSRVAGARGLERFSLPESLLAESLLAESLESDAVEAEAEALELSEDEVASSSSA